MQRKLIQRFSSCDSCNDLQQLSFVLMEDFMSSKYIIIKLSNIQYLKKYYLLHITNKNIENSFKL